MAQFTFLVDGFPIIVSFSLNAGVFLYEKEVTPPGFEAGGPIDLTNMRVTEGFRISGPKQLTTVTQISMNCAYDTDAYNDIGDMVGVNQLLSVVYPDGASIEPWGFIDSFKPRETKEGEQPMAEVVIHITNLDDTLSEVIPVFNPAP